MLQKIRSPWFPSTPWTLAFVAAGCRSHAMDPARRRLRSPLLVFAARARRSPLRVLKPSSLLAAARTPWIQHVAVLPVLLLWSCPLGLVFRRRRQIREVGLRAFLPTLSIHAAEKGWRQSIGKHYKDLLQECLYYMQTTPSNYSIHLIVVSI
jgi:hypothetical protein